MHEPNLRQAEKLVVRMMAIRGPSCRESKVAQFIVKKLLSAGAEESQIRFDQAHLKTPERGEVGNLVLKLPGKRGYSRRMLSAHMDTVPICVGTRPYVDNRMVRSRDEHTGLGADNRAGCAVVLSAALEILKHELPHPPLTFCWFVQEEIGLQGARCVQQSLWGKPSLAFNWDGGSPTKLTLGGTGGYRLDIQVRGIASHAGGAPEWGVSAITIASRAIAHLDQTGWLGRIQKGKQLGTSNIGVISGGQATNVVADQVAIKAEARSHDPRFRKRIVQEIEKAFHKAVREVKNVAGATGAVEIQGRLDYESFRLKKTEPCVQEVVSVIESLDEEAEFTIADGGLDANWITKHGIPAVSMGCGQLNQHMVSEALDLDGFDTAVRIGMRLATAGLS